jgi:soluble lytic murein transglycosylase-like protein
MLNTKQILFLGLGGVAIYYLVNNGNNPETAYQSLASDVTAAVAGWQNAGSGPTWMPVLNAAEVQYDLPQNMLAAVAYQESSFIENVIRGITPSGDGLSLGIMQLQTQFYPALVGPGVPVPYQDSDVENQINMAASVFANNFQALGSWPETIAAWNQGLSGVQNNGITSTSYVANILANAPAANV